MLEGDLEEHEEEVHVVVVVVSGDNSSSHEVRVVESLLIVRVVT